MIPRAAFFSKEKFAAAFPCQGPPKKGREGKENEADADEKGRKTLPEEGAEGLRNQSGIGKGRGEKHGIGKACKQYKASERGNDHRIDEHLENSE